jgi:hypothetical protein
LGDTVGVYHLVAVEGGGGEVENSDLDNVQSAAPRLRAKEART